MAWQPIETAPKDGTLVLLFDVSGHYGRKDHNGFTILVAGWCAYSPNDYRYPDGQWEAAYGPCSADNPTHWQPLPPPPGSPDEFVRIPRLQDDGSEV